MHDQLTPPKAMIEEMLTVMTLALLLQDQENKL